MTDTNHRSTMGTTMTVDHKITAQILRHRLEWHAWWREMQRVHPGGLVPVALAAWVLGVQKRRVVDLIAQGRLPVIDMPGGTRADRFIPADALLAAPSLLDRGRPLGQRSGERYPTRQGPRPNIYGSGSFEPTKWRLGGIFPENLSNEP